MSKARPLSSVRLSDGWKFKQSDDTAENAWLSVKRVPTNVHLDLTEHGKYVALDDASTTPCTTVADRCRIPDPFLGFNELQAEWVADKTWSYKVELPQVAEAKDGVVHVLAFDGLDTFATAKLNGETVLKSDNMFIPHRLDVTKKLKPGSPNVLEIDFASARLEAIKIKDAHPEHKWVGFNGDMSRLAVRKAQYHWGWDWGPMLNTCGPWREVRLETYQARIQDLRVDYKLSGDLKSVKGTITARVEGESARNVAFAVSDGDKLVFKESTKVSGGVAKVEFHVNSPKLWYPHGYGAQPLYKITATALAGEVELHEVSRRTGFRKGELIQEPDAIGKTFYFRINNIDVFCGGSDWIPADSFTPRVTSEKYRKWLEMMVDGYQVMIRFALTAYHMTYHADQLPGSGAAAFGKKTSSTICATSLACWSGRTLCLGAGIIPLFQRFWSRLSGSVLRMLGGCDIIPRS
jgi:beta-mannosidase